MAIICLNILSLCTVYLKNDFIVEKPKASSLFYWLLCMLSIRLSISFFLFVCIDWYFTRMLNVWLCRIGLSCAIRLRSNRRTLSSGQLLVWCHTRASQNLRLDFLFHMNGKNTEHRSNSLEFIRAPTIGWSTYCFFYVTQLSASNHFIVVYQSCCFPLRWFVYRAYLSQ